MSLITTAFIHTAPQSVLYLWTSWDSEDLDKKERKSLSFIFISFFIKLLSDENTHTTISHLISKVCIPQWTTCKWSTSHLKMVRLFESANIDNQLTYMSFFPSDEQNLNISLEISDSSPEWMVVMSEPNDPIQWKWWNFLPSVNQIKQHSALWVFHNWCIVCTLHIALQYGTWRVQTPLKTLQYYTSPQNTWINTRFPVPPSCSAETCDIYNDGASGRGCRSDTSLWTASDPAGQKIGVIARSVQMV